MRRALLTLLGVVALVSVVLAGAPMARQMPQRGWTPQMGGPTWMNPQLQEKLRDALTQRLKTVAPKMFEGALGRLGKAFGYGFLDRLPENATISEVRTFSGQIKEIAIEKDGGLVIRFESGDKVYELKGGAIIWREIGLKVGDKLEITGRIVKIDDKEYILVDKVKSAGKTYDSDELLRKRIQGRLKDWRK